MEYKGQIKYKRSNDKVKILSEPISEQVTVARILVGKETGEEYVDKQNVSLVKLSELYDEPVESWKSVRNKKLEKENVALNEELENERKRIKELVKFTKNKAKYFHRLYKNFNHTELKTLQLFLENRINWVVVSDFMRIEIAPFDEKIIDKSDLSKEEIKLVSLYGKDDGTLTYKIDQYSDGSGFSNNSVFFEEYGDAYNYIQEYINSLDELKERDIKAIEKYNMEVDNNLLIDYYKKKKERYENNLEQNLDSVKSTVNKIAEMENKIKEING